MAMQDLSVGIVGTGNIGTGLAELWARAGASVTLGARSAASAAALAPIDAVTVANFTTAAQQSVVVLAVAHDGAEQVAHELSPFLTGKVVITPMNALAVDRGRPASALPHGVTEGTWLANQLPESVIVRAFSHIQHELLVSRARRNPGLWSVGYAMDDGPHHDLVHNLLGLTGYAPVRVGTLSESQPLDPGGVFFPRMLTRAQAEDLVTAARLPQMMDKFNDNSIKEILDTNVTWTFPFAPSLGLASTFVGRDEVAARLRSSRDSGVRISDIRAESVTIDGAVIRATSHLPRANGEMTSEVVSIVEVAAGRITKVTEYWDTAAIQANH